MTISTASIPVEIKTYYDTQMLLNAVPNFVHNMWGKRPYSPAATDIPRGYGHTVEWRVMPEFAPVTAPLSETAYGYGGTPPAPVNVSVNAITATVDQYGAYAEVTDRVDFEAKDPILTEVSERLGRQAGETVDLLARNVLTGIANDLFPPGITNDAGITTETLTYQMLVHAWSRLAAANALPIENGRYVMIAHPFTVGDLMLDPQIQAIFEAEASGGDLSNPFRTAEVGTLLQTVVYQTSNAYVAAGAGGGTPPADVYYTLVIAQEAFGVAGFAGRTARDIVGEPQGNNTGRRVMPVDLIFKDFGTFDPFDTIATVAWKASWGGTVLNSNFAVRIHHTVSVS